jgi:RimJ/RimL family protein N-acetyltransferase
VTASRADGIREPDDTTSRIDLYRPSLDDVGELHTILSDPAVWTHFPSLRHTSIEQTAAGVRRWVSGWDADGLGTWVARERGTAGPVIGYGGCSMLGSQVWNLGYRFAVTAQSRGFATELSRRALERATETAPRIPVIAYLLEHNVASAAVARKLGFELVHRGPDAGNPDPSAVRLVFADRALTAAQLAAVLR